MSPYILDVSRVLSLGVQCALARDSDPFLFMFELHSADERDVKLGGVLVSALQYRKYKNLKCQHNHML